MTEADTGPPGQEARPHGHAGRHEGTPAGRHDSARAGLHESQHRGHAENKWWTLVAVCLGTFMLLLDRTPLSINALLPGRSTIEESS